MFLDSHFAERRRNDRAMFSPQSARAWLRVGQRLFPAFITDISRDGLGITVAREPPVLLGQAVRIEWLADTLESLPATVRHLHELESDYWQVGVGLDPSIPLPVGYGMGPIGPLNGDG